MIFKSAIIKGSPITMDFKQFLKTIHLLYTESINNLKQPSQWKEKPLLLLEPDPPGLLPR